MSTLVENVEKVKSAACALSASIEAKGVSVPAGTKLTGMPALVDQIQTGGAVEPTNDGRLTFQNDQRSSIVVPKTLFFDISLMTNFNNFFYECSNLTSLTLPDGFGQNATTMGGCFMLCRSLTSLSFPAGFGQKADNIRDCFYQCQSLNSLELPDGFGRNATRINSCFFACHALTSLALPDGFGLNCDEANFVFNGCENLTTITGNPNFKASLDLSPCTKLTHDSLMVVINGLQTNTTIYTRTLNLGSTNLAKLTDEEKKIATDKNWTLA